MNNKVKIEGYAVQVRPLSEEDGGGFEALFPQLARSVVGYGPTSAEAIADLMDAVPVFLEAIEQTGQTLPQPEVSKVEDDYSGKFNVRVPKTLHAQLARLAEKEGVSLNALVQTTLASGATALLAGQEFGVVSRPTLSQLHRNSEERKGDGGSLVQENERQTYTAEAT